MLLVVEFHRFVLKLPPIFFTLPKRFKLPGDTAEWYYFMVQLTLVSNLTRHFQVDIKLTYTYSSSSLVVRNVVNVIKRSHTNIKHENIEKRTKKLASTHVTAHYIRRWLATPIELESESTFITYLLYTIIFIYHATTISLFLPLINVVSRSFRVTKEHGREYLYK